uniref:IgGFc-binding protein-like n=1 Tax=Semicossyphus pulcher TaxID=241346 RepID=UPI0037E7E52E
MDKRLLALCLATALTAVGHSCSTGKEFITTFLPNFLKSGNTHQLHVVLTSQGAEAKVHIQVSSLKFSKQLTLPAGQTKWVSIPCEAELRKKFIHLNSAVQISSTAEISVVSFNRRFATGDGSVVFPNRELGTDHYVYTPSDGNRMDSLVAVVNGDSVNEITIVPAKDTELRGAKWKKGKAVAVTLKPFASYLIRGRKSLSGIRIQSQKPVAVLVGHQCLTLGAKCEHVYEQIPPVANLGNEYMVPMTAGSKATTKAVIVASEDDTEMTLNTGKKPQKHTLKTAGTSVAMKLTYKHAMVIKSNKKVMVMLLSNNKPHDPFLITLTPSSKLSTDWSVETVAGIPSVVSIISEQEGSGSVKVCLPGRCFPVKWKKLGSDKQWVWSNVAVGTQRSHVTVESDARMAVYVFGGKLRHGYGTSGVCAAVTPPILPPKDPCEDVNCREKERCVNGECVAVSSATCKAMGDPHYCTLDGRRYDFQGSCTYIMAAVVKKAEGLTDFTIKTKNNHRGSRRVAYVRIVTTTVYEQEIIINQDRGRVQVNGELQYLPVSLLGGKITVSRSGYYTVLTTDFGLVVKYDCNMRLLVTVPSSYYNHMGGLCGNYNGDWGDDLPDPRSSSVPIVLKMIKQWKEKDSDLFCHDNCGGRCPYCPPKQQEHFRNPKQCGIMSKEDGPFSACHKVVHPSMYLDNCVYDVCVNKGARRFLCDNLKSYNDACMSEGVKVDPAWREQTKCIPSCPAGSHYEACGSACPSSCRFLDSEKLCKALCVEGCQCDKGRVLSGDRCVPVAKCGCQYEGKYYPAATKFWGDNTCTTRCQCIKGKAKCSEVSCRKNEHCSLKKGVRKCYPASYATCQGSGDPHWKSLDNRRFDFQGTCTYVLSQLSKKSELGLEKYQVLVQNENRGRNKAVSYTKSVSLTVFGNVTVSMSRSNPGKIMVNGQSVNLPFSYDDGELTAYRQGYFGVVQTSFGLTLRFNWNSQVKLSLPSSYASETEGLCGNYNKNPQDDFMKSDGTLTKSANEFGHSWKAGGDFGCTSDCPGGKCPECEPVMVVQYQQGRYCGIISDKEGPFGQCHSKLDHRPFLTDCVFDLCMYKGHPSALCNGLTAFSTACQEAGAQLKSWRTQKLCPPSCGANSQYEVCAPPCQPTCSGMGPPDGCDESAPCTEGCVCDDGFMLSNDKCVPVAECGCQYEGQYFHNGQVFYRGQSCNTQCVCQDGGEVKCDPTFHCSAQEKCVLKDGSATCEPKSIGSCSVSGVRTIRSYDGKDYPLYGNCLFTLSKVEEKEGGKTPFSVLVQQQTDKDGFVTRSLMLQIYNLEITMDTGVVWEVKVDDIRTALPVFLDDGKVRVNQNGLHIIVETDFGLRMTYDTVGGVVVQIPSTYQSAPSGLCGNYNADASDDLEEGKPEDTAAAWVVNNNDVKCDTNCGATPCPGENKEKVPDAEEKCKIIKAEQGPFEGCHSTVKPTPYYDTCVKEVATHKGSNSVLCRHIQSYVAACQLAGAKIKEWRSEKLCPLKCPAGTHYELCGSSWSSTCSSLETPATSPVCQEGCQCDDGLMFDGANCVPVEKCGCVVDGLYYKSGASVLTGDCSELCSCQSGEFSCKETSCKKNEECRNKDGTIGCFPTDPCEETECRVKEHCEVTEGQAVCVPDSKALCWGFGDPHYSTLDGKSYSFQGTCSYVLVNTTGADSSLTEVTVTVKNELRGNSDGSFVRSITVEMLGHRIEIPSGSEDKIVLVDGINTELPLVLEEGHISITQSGIRGTIETDFGVEVTFDWASLVMITLSSSYFGNVVGLCGNYNGDMTDELTSPGGNAAANVTAWASSWSVPDGDPFCYHHCEGECPQCSQEDRKKYTGPEFCGILSNKAGPFAGCHARLPVAGFVSDCLYDVCIHEGRQEVLCEALAVYMAECTEAGATVSPWRELAECPVPCPENSHYSMCGSACPPSCGPQPEFCTSNCVEGCFCDKGYVRSGKGCVIRETGCGCDYDGHYYLPGQEFWGDAQCAEKCVCDAATQQVQCKAGGCAEGEMCSIKEGVQDCYPLSFKTCTARGDPHFSSFDKNKFDFQGNCVYNLASMCKDSPGLKPFKITLENNNRGNTRVSYAKVVTLEVFGKTFTLSKENPGKVLVDEVEQSLPFSWNQSLVQAYQRHRQAVVETHFLKVSYDFTSAVRVEVATSYQNTTCGLCGNMNSDPADDLTLPGGNMASSANEFGVSQWVADVEGCSKDCKDCPPPIPDDITPPAYTKACDVMTEKDGPLANCMEFLDVKEYHHDCVYDMMLNDGKQEAACNIISDYVQDCQREGVTIKPWRTKNFCWWKCPGNSVYDVNAPGCPLSCNARSQPAKCKNLPSEGCVCKRGQLLSKDGCVKLSKCGCTFKGQYIEPRQKFYSNDNCGTLCVCGKGKLVCRKKPCIKQQRCGVFKGVRGCFNKRKFNIREKLVIKKKQG